MQVPADDRPNLRCKAILVPIRRVVTELEIYAVKKLAIVRVWADEQQAYLQTVNRGAVICRNAVQREIKSRLEPVGHAVGPLGNAVEGFVRDDAARKCRSRQAIGCEIDV